MKLILTVFAAGVMTWAVARGFGYQTVDASALTLRPGISGTGISVGTSPKLSGMLDRLEEHYTVNQSQSVESPVLMKPKSRVLSAKEAKRVLKTGHSVDVELSQRTISQAFDLAHGRVLLLFEDGKGRLYESKDELQAMLDELERKAARGPESIGGNLPQGQAFAEQVPQLVRRLATQLNLDPAQLDGSEASLDKVDKALRRMNPERALAPDVFAPLTAYVGEVIRKATNGRWEMRRGLDAEKTWEPWIVDPSGRSCAPFGIYKELLEYGKAASLRGWVAGTLATWQLRNPQQGSPLP